MMEEVKAVLILSIPKILKILSAASFILFGPLDIITTRMAIGAGAVEANPFWTTEAVMTAEAAIFKLAFFLGISSLIFLCAISIERDRSGGFCSSIARPLALIAAAAFTLWGAHVVINNIIVYLWQTGMI